MSISFKVESYTARPTRAAGTSLVELEIEYWDKAEVLENFSIADVLSVFEEGELLNAIGKDAVMDHFDLEAKS